LSEAEFGEFDRYMKIADRAGAKLRREKSEAELRALAQETGQRWLTCQARLAHLVQNQAVRLSLEAASKDHHEADAAFHAVLAALGPEAVREELKRLSARIAATNNSVDVTPLFRLLPPDR
jgi:imidazoleglycerol phosphate dehydratase HisB